MTLHPALPPRGCDTGERQDRSVIEAVPQPRLKDALRPTAREYFQTGLFWQPNFHQ